MIRSIGILNYSFVLDLQAQAHLSVLFAHIYIFTYMFSCRLFSPVVIVPVVCVVGLGLFGRGFPQVLLPLLSKFYKKERINTSLVRGVLSRILNGVNQNYHYLFQ